jgi:hypothetical protein
MSPPKAAIVALSEDDFQVVEGSGAFQVLNFVLAREQLSGFDDYSSAVESFNEVRGYLFLL